MKRGRINVGGRQCPRMRQCCCCCCEVLTNQCPARHWQRWQQQGWLSGRKQRMGCSIWKGEGRYNTSIFDSMKSELSRAAFWGTTERESKHHPPPPPNPPHPRPPGVTIVSSVKMEEAKRGKEQIPPHILVVEHQIRAPNVSGGNPDLFDATVILRVPQQVHIFPLLEKHNQHTHGRTKGVLWL